MVALALSLRAVRVRSSLPAEVPFIDQTFYTGPLVRVLGGTDISWIVGAVAAVVFYLIALQVPARGAGVAGQASMEA